MSDCQIFIRIPDQGMDFVYSIRRAGNLIETGRVAALAPVDDEFVPPGFYGGSQAMD